MSRTALVTAVAAAATAATAALAPAALAGPPGRWTQVTPAGSELLNFQQVGLLRTGDSVLHVGWARQDAGNAGSALHSTISADARTIGGPSTIFANPDGVNESVVLVPQPGGGLRAFFAATNTFDSVLATATSPDGNAWTVQGSASRTGPQHKPVYAASGIGAAVGNDGTFYSIWGDSSPNGGGLHIGLDPAAPDADLPGGLKHDTNIAADSQSSAVYAAWNSLADEGVVFLPIANPVAAAGNSIPNSAPQSQHRVGITGRIGAPGVFIAYTQGTNPFLAKPAVFRVDTQQATRISSKDGEDIAISAAPGGRLWTVWKDGTTIYAARSNAAATRWGRIVAIKAPSGASTVYDVAGEGSAGPLDVVALVDTGTLAEWHQRILPALSLSRKSGRRGRRTFTVTDAGEPVSGARVRVSGRGGGSKTTRSNGKVTFTLGSGRHEATVTKSGYGGTSSTFRVR